MRWRKREPTIWIGPRPRRRRRRILAAGLIVLIVGALVLAPGRPSLKWAPEEACAEHVVCTISNWKGNWISLARVWVAIKDVYKSILDLRNLITQKWNEFLQYRRRVDFALSVIRDPQAALRDYLLVEGRNLLEDLYRQEAARFRTRVDVATAQISAALGIDSARVQGQDWMDFATQAAHNAPKMAKILLRRSQPPVPTKQGGRKVARANEQAIQLQLPTPPSEQEVAQALQAANPATSAEAAREVSRAVAARKWAASRMREALMDMIVANMRLHEWVSDLPTTFTEIDRQPYTSAIKTIAKVSIENQILLLRILREIAAQNLVNQATYAQEQAKRAHQALREAQAEAR